MSRQIYFGNEGLILNFDKLSVLFDKTPHFKHRQNLGNIPVT